MRSPAPSPAPQTVSSPAPLVGHDPLKHSVFIIYSESDGRFVEEFLVPALGLPRPRVLLCTAFTPGAPIVGEIERGVTTSAVTVAVLSPAYLRDRWARFTDELAGYASGTDARLVPLLLVPCDIPLALRFRVMLDFTEEARWRDEAARLCEFLQSASPKGENATQRPTAPPTPATVGTSAAQSRVRAAGLALGGSLIVAIALVGLAKRGARATGPPGPGSAVAAPMAPATSGASDAARLPVVPASSADARPVPRAAAPPPRPPSVPDPDPRWSGDWWTEVTGAHEFSLYSLRVVGRRVVVEGASVSSGPDAGGAREPLRIVSQQWLPDSGHLDWTVSRAPTGASVSMECRLESDGSMHCTLSSPDAARSISYYVLRRATL